MGNRGLKNKPGAKVKLDNVGDKHLFIGDNAEKNKEKFVKGVLGKIEIEANADKEKGFDINDKESIQNFEINYTPLGSTILVKEVYEESKVGGIIIPPGAGDGKKAVIIEAGLLVETLEKGDVVALHEKDSEGNTIQFSSVGIERKFKGVKFIEYPYALVKGVYANKRNVLERIAKRDKERKAIRDGS